MDVIKPVLRDPKYIARMRTAFELHKAAKQIMLQNFRRRHPEESEAQIRERLQAWLFKEPFEPSQELPPPPREGFRWTHFTKQSAD